MAEDQATHRQACEKMDLERSHTTARLVIGLVGLFCLGALCGGIYLIAAGHKVEGLAVLAANLATAIGSAWFGRRHEAPTPSPPAPTPAPSPTKQRRRSKKK